MVRNAANRTAPKPGEPIRRLATISAADATTTQTGERYVDVVASDETVDRYGDIVSADGWDLEPFQKNPIALWQHDYSAPIGTCEHVRVDRGRLLARLCFAASGVSARIDELWSLVAAGVLRAVSVGFMLPTDADYEPIVGRDGHVTGWRYLRQELLELSLVSVPANRNCIALAKTLVRDVAPYFQCEERTMNPHEQPTGPLIVVGDPTNLSGALPADLAQQIERNGRVSCEVRRSIRDIAVARNVLGETVPAGEGVAPPTSVRLVDGSLVPAPLLLSLLPRVAVEGGSITQNVISYDPPADAGNKAAKVAEATAKPESDLVCVSTVLPIEKWSHHVGLTKEALADVPALRQLVDSILTRGLLAKVDGGVFTTLSTAATPFAPAVGSGAADNAAVAAGQLAALGGSGIVVAMNPADLVAIDTAKAVGSGIYIGRPPIPGQLVGVPAVPPGKLLAFASEGAYLAERESVTVAAGISGDDFVKNIVRLLAEWRGRTVVQMPQLLLYGDAVGGVAGALGARK